mmetsp:Transcript_26447/g.66283  ORF Transcript_26447/g.66283 Transcript_26447/m.66283 type:complete len:240 (-) Transcript_26447:1430-2149(-)
MTRIFGTFDPAHEDSTYRLGCPCFRDMTCCNGGLNGGCVGIGGGGDGAGTVANVAVSLASFDSLSRFFSPSISCTFCCSICLYCSSKDGINRWSIPSVNIALTRAFSLTLARVTMDRNKKSFAWVWQSGLFMVSIIALTTGNPWSSVYIKDLNAFLLPRVKAKCAVNRQISASPERMHRFMIFCECSNPSTILTAAVTLCSTTTNALNRNGVTDESNVSDAIASTRALQTPFSTAAVLS